jgi:HlyD family secretion protein
MKIRKWWYGAATGLVLAGFGGWKLFGRSGEAETLYTVETVKRQDLKESVTANGEIQALSRVNVGTTVTGEIKIIHVKDGQMVKVGDLLVTLDQERFKQDLNHAELALRMARQDQENAEATFRKQLSSFQRQQTLFDQGLISVDQFQDIKLAKDNADITLQRAKVAVQQAQSQVALAQDALDKTVLRAPMAGRITGLKAEKGETAIAGQTNIAGAVLMVISDMSELIAESKISELEVAKLQPGQPSEIQVDAIPGMVFQGRVLNVATSADRGSNQVSSNSNQEAQNYKVRVQISGTRQELDRLRPGMSARVAVLANEVKQVVTVPLQAILEREDRNGGLGLMARSKSMVYVLKGETAEERILKLGASTRRAAEVLEGVKEGEQIISGPPKGLSALAQGKKVKLAKLEEPSGAKK